MKVHVVQTLDTSHCYHFKEERKI